MNNKKTLKNILEEKINQENIYEKVLEKHRKKQIKKWVLIPTCFLIILSLLLQIRIESNFKEKNEKLINETNNTFLNDSNSQNSNSSFKNEKYQFVNSQENIVLPFDNLELPTDLTEIKNQNIYKEKEIIGIKKIYHAKLPYRFISISLFYNKIMLEEEKTTIINNIKCKIYRNSFGFIVQFDYRKYHIQIETLNINQEELITLLKSL